jgi:bidirectional [NiFe] hydrogenase diaphorase subunit
MHRLLTRFAEKRATSSDLALLEQLCDLTKHTSLCGLGQSAPNPVLSTLRYFREEYLAAVVDGEHGDGRLALPLAPAAPGQKEG